MSVYQYNPDDWLVSTTRAIESYVRAAFDSQFYEVEMAFPDTANWTRATPLTKTLIHFEQDDIDDPTWAMGQPGVDVFNESMGTFVLHEAARHRVNYDVGVWASAASGGETSRMRAVQRLKNLFVPVGAKAEFHDTTGGVKIVTFNGGRNHPDRINDLPVYRTSEMTLVVEVFSRHVPEFEEIVPDDYDQTQNLVIDDNQPV